MSTEDKNYIWKFLTLHGVNFTPSEIFTAVSLNSEFIVTTFMRILNVWLVLIEVVLLFFTGLQKAFHIQENNILCISLKILVHVRDNLSIYLCIMYAICSLFSHLVTYSFHFVFFVFFVWKLDLIPTDVIVRTLTDFRGHRLGSHVVFSLVLINHRLTYFSLFLPLII